MRNILLIIFAFVAINIQAQGDPVFRSINFSVANATAMNAIPSSKVGNGQTCYRLDTKTVWIYDVDQWRNTGVGPNGSSGGGAAYTAGTGLSLIANQFSVTNPFEAADETKLDGIATGATVGANWNTNLSNIPVNLDLDGNNDVTLTGNQTISGTKTFSTAIATSEFRANGAVDGYASLYPGNLQIVSTSDTSTWRIGNREGTDISNRIGIRPKGNWINSVLEFDYGSDDRWEIDNSPIITAANAAANGIGDSATIPDNAVTTAKILNRTILPEDIALNSITGAELADNSVNSAEINNNSVTLDKISAATGTNGQVLEIVAGEPSWENKQTAIEIPIADTGGNFTATDVEGALAELATNGGGGTGMTVAQITLEANRALPPLRINRTADISLGKASTTYTSGENIGRRTVNFNTAAINYTIIDDFDVDDVLLFMTSTADANLLPASGGSLLINGTPTPAGVTLSGNYGRHAVIKVATNLWDIISDDLVAFAPAPSNLYQESSGANGGTGVGSFIALGGGTVTRVADATFTGGTAIEINNGGAQFGGASIGLLPANVATWSNNTITQLDPNDVYRFTMQVKKQNADAHQPYYAVRIAGAVGAQGTMIDGTTVAVENFTFDLTVPAGGITGTSRIEFSSDINTTAPNGWLRIGDFNVTKITDN